MRIAMNSRCASHQRCGRNSKPACKKVYASGRQLAATVLETVGTDREWLPRTRPYTLAEILEENWFPTNIYGFDRLET